MAYALDTKKRKFVRLLDSISQNGSSTSLAAQENGDGATVSLTVEPVSKKARLERLSRPQITECVGKSSTSLSSSFSRITQKSRSSPHKLSQQDTKEMDPLTFSPEDRKQFMRRLATFRETVGQWGTKPKEINEVAWAKRGWELYSHETVACMNCKATVSIDLGSEDADEYSQARLLQKYHGLLVQGHHDPCGWAEVPSPESIHQISFLAHPNVFADIEARLIGLCSIGGTLHNRVTIPEDLDTDMCDLAIKYVMALNHGYLGHNDLSDMPKPFVPPEFVKNEEATTKLHRLAMGLALQGWKSGDTKDPAHITIKCEGCFRRVGLWMFGPQELLNPTAAHYDYCPYINAKTQNAGMSNFLGAGSGNATIETFRKLENVWSRLETTAQFDNAPEAERLEMAERVGGRDKYNLYAATPHDVFARGVWENRKINGRRSPNPIEKARSSSQTSLSERAEASHGVEQDEAEEQPATNEEADRHEQTERRLNRLGTLRKRFFGGLKRRMNQK